jgi:rubrerythrin
MDLLKTLAELAAFERRAIMLYRAYAERFSANPAVSRLWSEMSEAEAGHFATLTLAGDLLDLPGNTAPNGVSLAAPPTNVTDALYRAAETAVTGSLELATAVETAFRLEQNELPWMRTLLVALAGRARASILTGVLPVFATHLDCLETLAIMSGRTDLTVQIRALQAEATSLPTA